MIMPLDKSVVEKLSYQMFENTFKYNLTRKIISEKSKTDTEDVLRLQSGNPFVSKESFDKVKAYMNSLPNLVDRETEKEKPRLLKETSVNIGRSVMSRTSQVEIGRYFGTSSALQKSVLSANLSGESVKQSVKAVGKSVNPQEKTKGLIVSNNGSRKNKYYGKLIRDTTSLKKATNVKDSMFAFSSTKTSSEEYVLSSYATTNGR